MTGRRIPEQTAGGGFIIPSHIEPSFGSMEMRAPRPVRSLAQFTELLSPYRPVKSSCQDVYNFHLLESCFPRVAGRRRPVSRKIKVGRVHTRPNNILIEWVCNCASYSVGLWSFRLGYCSVELHFSSPNARPSSSTLAAYIPLVTVNPEPQSVIAAAC